MQGRFVKGSFIIVPNKGVINGAPAYMQAVYLWLCAYADDEGICYPSRSRLAADAGCSVRSVDNAIESMVIGGMLRKVTRKDPSNPKQNLSNIYQLMQYHHEGGGAGDAPGWRTICARGGASGAERTTTTKTTTNEKAVEKSTAPFEVVSDSPQPKTKVVRDNAAFALRGVLYRRMEDEMGHAPTINKGDYIQLAKAYKKLGKEAVMDMFEDALHSGKLQTLRGVFTDRAIDVYAQENL